MKKPKAKKHRYTDTAVYCVNVYVPITYYAGKNNSYFDHIQAHTPKSQIFKRRKEIEKVLSDAGYDDFKVAFDGFQVPF